MKRYFIFVALSLIFLCFSSVHAGFGISPPYVKNDHLLPEEVYVQEITVSRSEANEDWRIDIKPELSEEIAGWFTYEFDEKNIIPIGQQYAILKIRVEVPKDAIKKEYRGAIRLIGGPSKDAKISGTGTKIALGAKIDVAIRVLDKEIKDFQVNSVNILNAKTNEPLAITLAVKNNGNIYDSLGKIKVKIFDSKKTKIIDTLELKIKEEIKPQEARELKVEFPNKYKPGKYLANLKIYYGGKVIKKQEAAFQIRNAFVEKNKLLDLAKKHPYLLTAIGGILAFLVFFSLYLLRKKRKKMPSHNL